MSLHVSRAGLHNYCHHDKQIVYLHSRCVWGETSGTLALFLSYLVEKDVKDYGRNGFKNVLC